jgi:hypothetical protein
MYSNRNNALGILSLYTKGYGNKYFLREISRKTGLPLKNTQKALCHLEESKILKSRVFGRNKYFELNRDNPATKLLLINAELVKTIEFMEFYPAAKPFLKALHSDTPVIVFGSFAKLNGRKDSDMDMIVLGKKEDLPFHLLPYKPHCIFMSKAGFWEAMKQKEPLIKEVEDNHIVLNNPCHFVQRMWSCYG